MTTPIDGNFGASGSSVEPPDRAVATAQSRGHSTGLPGTSNARQSAQCLTTTREPRTDGSNRDIESRSDFSVTHSLQADEQDYQPLHSREFGDSALEIAQLEPPSLLRCAGQQRLALAQPDRRPFPRGSPEVINVLVMKYREQPRTQIRSLLPQMQLAKGPSQAVLDEIVCGDEVSGERARIASKTGNFRFDVPIRVRHRGLLPMATIGGRESQSPKSIAAMLSDDVRASGFV
jgi:hypothetical protein